MLPTGMMLPTGLPTSPTNIPSFPSSASPPPLPGRPALLSSKTPTPAGCRLLLLFPSHRSLFPPWRTPTLAGPVFLLSPLSPVHILPLLRMPTLAGPVFLLSPISLVHTLPLWRMLTPVGPVFLLSPPLTSPHSPPVANAHTCRIPGSCEASNPGRSSTTSIESIGWMVSRSTVFWPLRYIAYGTGVGVVRHRAQRCGRSGGAVRS
eukprot:365244-Chlamydomonas_euryale.AAC.5